MRALSGSLTPVLVALAVVALGACSSSRMVQVPPRMDLRGMGPIGMVTFSSNEGDEIAVQATREFLSALQSAQPGVPVLEIPAPAGGALDPAAVRALGKEHGVSALIVGVLEAKPVKPKVSVGGGLESLNAKAEIEAQLNAKLYEAGSGATMWSSLAHARETVASVSVTGGGLAGIGANSRDDANGRLVRELVAQATEDFRPGWVRQRN
ncbi:MAG TPA: hypothetical protein VKU85_06155 [bacterium]|nr:hypothetical protein [bacterium]